MWTGRALHVSRHASNNTLLVLSLCFVESEKRFRHVYVDLPESRGYRYVFTAIDCFTRWPEAIPLQNLRAFTVAVACVHRWVIHLGILTQGTICASVAELIYGDFVSLPVDADIDVNYINIIYYII